MGCTIHAHVSQISLHTNNNYDIENEVILFWEKERMKCRMYAERGPRLTRKCNWHRFLYTLAPCYTSLDFLAFKS